MGAGRGEITSALLNYSQMAVLMAEVRAITLQTCWDGLKEDLLMFVSAPGSDKLRGTAEKMSYMKAEPICSMASPCSWSCIWGQEESRTSCGADANVCPTLGRHSWSVTSTQAQPSSTTGIAGSPSSGRWSARRRSPAGYKTASCLSSSAWTSALLLM